MKTPEDEAFDDLARKQGAWGGGFTAKRQAAMDKVNQEFTEEYIKYRTAFPKGYTAPQQEPVKHWSDCAVHNAPAYPAGPCDCGVAQEPEREALKLALKLVLRALDDIANKTHDSWLHTPQAQRMARELIKPIEAALAQPAQEPKRPWVGLEKSDMPDGENLMFDHEYFIAGMVFASNVLKEKNT